MLLLFSPEQDFQEKLKSNTEQLNFNYMIFIYLSLCMVVF